VPEHFLIKQGTGMSIFVLSRNRTTIPHDQIGSFFQETPKGTNASVSLQIKSDPLVDTSLAKMTVIPSLVAVLSQEGLVITQIATKHLGMDRGILPTLVRNR